jgi:hypothetical protein
VEEKKECTLLSATYLLLHRGRMSGGERSGGYILDKSSSNFGESVLAGNKGRTACECGSIVFFVGPFNSQH